MKKRTPNRLTLNRETLLQLDKAELKAAGAAATLTYEGSCDNSFCPCPTDTHGTQDE